MCMIDLLYDQSSAIWDEDDVLINEWLVEYKWNMSSVSDWNVIILNAVYGVIDYHNSVIDYEWLNEWGCVCVIDYFAM